MRESPLEPLEFDTERSVTPVRSKIKIKKRRQEGLV